MFFALFAATAPFAATVDLSTLPGNYEAQDGDVLTGTLEGISQPYKISIADGATVTLSDATINGTSERVCKTSSSRYTSCDWAGLTCLGNQKKEYSTPTVKVVELKHQAQLMETSGSEPPTTGGGLL